MASRNREKVQNTVTALQNAGAAKAIGMDFDVRDAKAVKYGLESAHAEFGPIDVLVSGAAGNFPALAAEMSINAFRSVIEIDLMGTIHVMKAAYPLLARPGASVINISAPQAFQPSEGQAHVCAAKAGVDQITRTLALEWGPEGIRVNSVVPGCIEGTEGMRRLSPDDSALDGYLNSIPIGRFGRAVDVSNVCLFLSSMLGSYVTGSVISVDGGFFLRGSGQLGLTLRDMLSAPTVLKER